MTTSTRAAIEAALAAGPTDGPWAWFGEGKYNQLYLATVLNGRRYVMDFVRWGMKGAQPRFQINGLMEDAKDLFKFEVGNPSVTGVAQAKADSSVYRFDVAEIDHPDARWIAACNPAAIRQLFSEQDAETKKLSDELARVREAAEVVLTNEDHAVTCEARSYQKGSPTWQAYRDLRAALTTTTKEQE